MVIFNSYVSLPEGTQINAYCACGMKIHIFQLQIFVHRRIAAIARICGFPNASSRRLPMGSQLRDLRDKCQLYISYQS